MGDSGAWLEYKFHPEINQESAEIELRKIMGCALHVLKELGAPPCSLIKT